MDRSSFQSSESESSFLNESLLDQNPESRFVRNAEAAQKNMEVVFKKELLEKYPILLAEILKILGQRSSNQELKKLASEYQQIYDQLKLQGNLSNVQQKQQNQQNEEPKNVKIVKKHKELKEQIDSMTQQRENMLDQIQEKRRQKLSNRLKIKLLTKLIKEANQNENNKPYQEIDQQYRGQITKILKQYEDDLKNSKLGTISQDPNREYNQPGMKQQAQRNRIKDEIAKLQSQILSFKKITSKQNELIQSLKQEIKKSQKNQEKIYEQLKIQGDVNLKRNIVGDMVETFISKQMNEGVMDYGLQKTVDEYVKNIQQVKTKTIILKQQLQQQSFMNAEKRNLCILLEKKLAQLRKQNRQQKNNLNKQSQAHDKVNTQLMNNEQMILRTYHFEGNKIQSEISQIEAQQKSKEISMFLENQTKNNPEINQKVPVKPKPLGWIQKILPIKNSKQLMKWILIIWFIILVLFYLRAFLIRYDYLPQPEPARAPRTIVHRYQGKNRIVDGEVVNIVNFDQDSVENPQGLQQDFSSPKQVIIVEPVAEHPKKTWVDILMMEYK